MKKHLAAVITAVAVSISSLAAAAPAAVAAPAGAPYVALGDSVASGNGILPYSDKQCLRSKRSYPELLAKELGVDVVSAACSGASTVDVAQQIVALGASGALGPATELVTLTVGVNNVQFDADPEPDWPDALGACSGSFTLQFCEFVLDTALSVLKASLPQEIEARIAEIRAEAPHALIVVTGYPLPFGDVTGTCNAGLFRDEETGTNTLFTFEAAQTIAINEAVLRANALIAEGVRNFQTSTGEDGSTVVYVDVNDVPDGVEGFDGHGVCDRGNPWISRLIPAPAATTDRGFHPNAAGQAAYADIIGAVIGQ
ncbi:SGNH/GDSL hydrolase family protein [Microbacterium sp.]|uniref:SGNH/GDSL hydrolase family protein n=1 Tax=Microbacterium sp. TaxID=51671 RepID=UPI002E35F00B|nr:SGNH/GDSL hydrolase family protein [Microbacterium sp.]HEX5728349.1 SGNH/GDSL hydrolase family protein [Microbacterium sp.]